VSDAPDVAVPDVVVRDVPLASDVAVAEAVVRDVFFASDVVVAADPPEAPDAFPAGGCEAQPVTIAASTRQPILRKGLSPKTNVHALARFFDRMPRSGSAGETNVPIIPRRRR
jgi:hypothetical protein